MDELLPRILQRAAQEADNEAHFRRHYTFTRTKRTDTRDSKGELQKTEEKSSTYDPANAPAARKAAAALSEESLKTGEARGRAFEKRDFALDDDLLERFRFSVAAREVVEGRPAIKLDFVPASRDLPVKSFKDRFINKAAGSVWIDEADAALAKVELQLTEEVTVAGGLVGSVKKCLYSFLRERTPEGWWFTRNVNWHLEGRQFFTRKVMDYAEQRTGVRRVR